MPPYSPAKLGKPLQMGVQNEGLALLLEAFFKEFWNLLTVLMSLDRTKHMSTVVKIKKNGIKT